MQKNNVNMDDSVVLGQGSYGCVIKPSPKCENILTHIRNDNPKNKVAKIYITNDKTVEKSIKNEVDIGIMLSKWDSEHKYFAIPTELCLNKRNTLTSYKAFRKCENIPEQQKDFKLLIMEDEGKDILEIATAYKNKYKKGIPLKGWIALLKNILKGVELLIQHQYVHQDIKSVNIAYNYNTNLLKLLDFGLSKSFSELYTIHNNRLKHYYYVYPFEYLLINDYLYNKQYKNYKKETFYYIIENTWNEYLYDFGYKSYTNYVKFVSLDNMKQKIKKEIENYLKSPESYYKRICNFKDKIDVYGIGMMCIDTDHYLDDSDLTEKQKEKYIYFISRLVDIHPESRFTIQEALKYYDTILL
jgi:serine/threonine protein kinase